MKRKWFQIHLSTAIVLMFAAGGMLWANIRKVPGVDRVEISGPVGDPKTGIRPPRPPGGWGYMRTIYVGRGWPVTYLRGYGDPGYESSEWNLAALLFDVSFAAGILIVVAFISEWNISRREACKS